MTSLVILAVLSNQDMFTFTKCYCIFVMGIHLALRLFGYSDFSWNKQICNLNTTSTTSPIFSKWKTDRTYKLTWILEYLKGTCEGQLSQFLHFILFLYPFFCIIFLSKYHNVNALRHILTPPHLFFFFLSSYQCSIFSDIFWCHLLLFIVFVCLDGFDVLRHNWPSLFFFNILYQIITRSMFSDIFWPFPLFFNCFCLVVKIQFSPTYLGPSLPFFIFCPFWWSWRSPT